MWELAGRTGQGQPESFCTHLLGYEVQPALQGVGNLNLAIPIIDFNATSSAEHRK